LNKIVVVILFSISLIVAGCGGGGGSSIPTLPSTETITPPSQPISGFGNITGFIKKDGVPVEGAKVTIYKPNTTNYSPLLNRAPGSLEVFSTISDKNGYYEFINIPAANYILTAEKDGESCGYSSKSLAPGDTITTDIELSITGSIEGKIIIEGESNNIPAIWLEGTSFGAFGHLISQENGKCIYEYRITGVPVPGDISYNLRVMMGGFISHVESVELGFDKLNIDVSEITLAPYIDGEKPPIVSLHDTTSPVELGSLVTLTASVSDPNGDPMTYLWTQTGGPSTTLVNQDSLEVSFTAEEAGIYTFMFTANDGRLTSTPKTITIVVDENTPPISEPGLDHFDYFGNTITLDGSNSYDEDGDSLTYSWTQLTGPEVTLNMPNSSTPTFIADKVGFYVHQLTVNDGEVDSVPHSVDIMIDFPEIDSTRFTIQSSDTDKIISAPANTFPPNIPVYIYVPLSDGSMVATNTTSSSDGSLQATNLGSIPNSGELFLAMRDATGLESRPIRISY